MPISHKKVLSTILFSAVIIIGVILILSGEDAEINRKNIEYIRSLGWEIEEDPREITRVAIPMEFDGIYGAYADMLKESGFKLQEYKGKTAVKYSYSVTNHRLSHTGLIRANIFVIDKKIVAGDISSLEIGGFIQPIDHKDGQ